MMLSVENVTRQFGGFKAVDGVSLQLAEREILGIAGTNGARRRPQRRPFCPPRSCCCQ